MLSCWCVQVEEQFKDKVSFVMLNIENPKWAPEVAEYRIDGVPHFLFLNSRGEPEAAAVGRLPKQVHIILVLSVHDVPAACSSWGNVAAGPGRQHASALRGHPASLQRSLRGNLVTVWPQLCSGSHITTKSWLVGTVHHLIISAHQLSLCDVQNCLCQALNKVLVL